MKRKRFSVEQIVGVLKQAEVGVPVAELIRRAGISEQTFYRWKKQYVGLEVDQIRQLKQPQEENGHTGIPPPGGTARASELLCQHVLQHRLVQRQIRHQLLQPAVLFLQLLGQAGQACGQQDMQRSNFITSLEL